MLSWLPHDYVMKQHDLVRTAFRHNNEAEARPRSDPLSCLPHSHWQSRLAHPSFVPILVHGRPSCAEHQNAVTQTAVCSALLRLTIHALSGPITPHFEAYRSAFGMLGTFLGSRMSA